MSLKTFKNLRIEEELCEQLDSEIYLPVKAELAGKGISHTLGIRKENFKGFIDKKFKELRRAAIKCVKEDVEDIAKGKVNVINLNDRWMKRLNITEADLMTQEEINAREHGEVGNN